MRREPGVFEPLGERPTPFTDPGLRKTRTPDDVVTIREDMDELLPAGRYAVEDKTGRNAFDIVQAEDYARMHAPDLPRRTPGEIGGETGGFRLTAGAPDAEYDGLVYVFSREGDAARAFDRMGENGGIRSLLGRHPGGIHVTYYNDDGVLVRLTSRPGA
jgi:hypothetical protein